MKDLQAYGKKMARKGRTEVIYKGTFISDRSLICERPLMLYAIICTWRFVQYDKLFCITYVMTLLKIKNSITLR